MKNKRVKSGLMRYAESELKLAGYLDSSDRLTKLMVKNIVKMIEIFSKVGHSGSSAWLAIWILNRLLRFSPLTNLTGDRSEWMKVSGDTFQNIRCSTVFAKTDTGEEAYNLDGVIIKFKNGDEVGEAIKIKFPYFPPTTIEVVDLATQAGEVRYNEIKDKLLRKSYIEELRKQKI